MEYISSHANIIMAICAILTAIAVLFGAIMQAYDRYDNLKNTLNNSKEAIAKRKYSIIPIALLIFQILITVYYIFRANATCSDPVKPVFVINVCLAFFSFFMVLLLFVVWSVIKLFDNNLCLLKDIVDSLSNLYETLHKGFSRRTPPKEPSSDNTSAPRVDVEKFRDVE